MTNQRPADELRSFRDRIVRLEEEKKTISDDIKDVYLEAKGRGYDVKALHITVKRSMEDDATRRDRQTTETIAELYMGTLGMLEGTPLGDATRKRLMAEEPAGDEAPPPEDAPTADDRGSTVDEARGEGQQAAEDGQRIIDNPYTAGDPRRAAWDEGWCAATGSDGMDIPEAWRRKDRKKAKEDTPAGDAPEVDPDQEVMPFGDEAGSRSDDAEDGHDGSGGASADDLYSQAVAVVMRDKKASTSYIQRRLQIGYNRAALIMERMENEGIVGPANYAGKREILAKSVEPDGEPDEPKKRGRRRAPAGDGEAAGA